MPRAAWRRARTSRLSRNCLDIPIRRSRCGVICTRPCDTNRRSCSGSASCRPAHKVLSPSIFPSGIRTSPCAAGGFTAFVVKERMLYDTFFTQKTPAVPLAGWRTYPLKMGAQYRPQAVDMAAALVALSGACLTYLLCGSFTVTSSPGLSPDSVSLPHPQHDKPETLSVISDFYCSMKCEEFLSMAHYFSTAQFAQRTSTK